MRDVFDFIMPVTDFASWLRNFRMRRELQQVELAKKLGVSNVTICRYERRASNPAPAILEKLRAIFKLDGEFEQFLKGGKER